MQFFRKFFFVVTTAIFKPKITQFANQHPTIQTNLVLILFELFLLLLVYFCRLLFDQIRQISYFQRNCVMRTFQETFQDCFIFNRGTCLQSFNYRILKSKSVTLVYGTKGYISSLFDHLRLKGFEHYASYLPFATGCNNWVICYLSYLTLSFHFAIYRMRY